MKLYFLEAVFSTHTETFKDLTSLELSDLICQYEDKPNIKALNYKQV